MDTSNERISPLVLMSGFAVLSLVYVVGKLIFTFYVDPLKSIPGPKINAISRIPYARDLLGGTTAKGITALHEKYGEVVRISPNEVSFISAETAFSDIYGFRTGKLRGHLNMQKDPVWYPPPTNGVPSILVADDNKHSDFRRLLSHAFSEKALAEQEPLVQNYVDQLIDRLREITSKSSSPQDMTKWYNWTTFDVIADLLFGEPFGCLQDLQTHRYIELLFKSLKGFRLYYIMHYFPVVTKMLGPLLVDKKVLKGRKEYMSWVFSQTQKRVARDTQRADFITHILAHKGEKGLTMTDDELNSNAAVILTAGSETTATLLSGATYLLLRNPDKFEKLKQEVRGRWKSYDEITFAEVNSAPYLLACLSEALRYFPPVPVGFERRVGAGGEYVSGYYLPEGTAVSVSHLPAYHSEHNFKHANSFIPERWMDDPEYANDKRSACQPFSFGPRNCLGKNLAYAEMRLIMARMVWSFDLELDPRSADWIDRCKVMTLWEKPELWVKVTEVVR